MKIRLRPGKEKKGEEQARKVRTRDESPDGSQRRETLQAGVGTLQAGALDLRVVCCSRVYYWSKDTPSLPKWLGRRQKKVWKIIHLTCKIIICLTCKIILLICKITFVHAIYFEESSRYM